MNNLNDAHLGLRPSISSTTNPKGNATMRYLFNVLLSVAMVFMVAFPTSASAQAEEKAPPAASTTDSSMVLEINSWEELIEFLHFANRFINVGTQGGFKDRAQGSAKTIFQKTFGEHKAPNKPKSDNLYGKFVTLFNSFQGALQLEGSKIPAKQMKVVMAFMKRNGCEVVDGKATEGCATLHAWHAKAFDDRKSKFSGNADMASNATELRTISDEYEGPDAVIMVMAAHGIVTPLLPKADRLWNLSDGALGAFEMAQKAKESDSPFFLMDFPEEPFTKKNASGLEGQQGCVMRKNADPHCGTISDVGDDSLKVAGEEVTYEELNDGDAILTVGKPSGGANGTGGAKQAHKAGESYQGRKPAALAACGDIAAYEGHDACFYSEGNEPVCGVISDANDDGVKFGGTHVSCEDLMKGYVFASDKSATGGSSAADSRLQLSLRGVMRFGSAPEYEGFTGNTGFMAVGRYFLHPNVAAHMGLGIGGLTGRPTLGVTEADSRAVIMGLAGFRFLLGGNDWWAVPIAETNLTFQGQRPGMEVALGLELFRKSKFDLSVMGTYGHYPTGQVLYTHPDRDTESFTLSGVGIAIEGGWTF